MAVYKLTPEIVRGLAKYLCKKHGAAIVDKESAVEMEAIAHGLDVMGIQDHDGFLKRYAR